MSTNHGATSLSPVKRLRPPQAEYWFGTDMLGRDVYSRVVYGARESVIAVAPPMTLAVVLGAILGAILVACRQGSFDNLTRGEDRQESRCPTAMTRRSPWLHTTTQC